MKTWWNWRPRERMQRDKRKKSLKNWEIHKAGNGKRLFFPWGGTVSFGAQDQKAECNPLPPCQLWWENKELLYYSVVKNLPATQEFQEMWVQFLGREDPLKEGIIPIPIFGLTWWLRRLPAMRETWVWSLGQEDPLEKEMATHPSTLAWKIPWTEEPCRLQSLGSQRVGHNWATSLHFFTSYYSDTSGSFLQKGRQKWNQQGTQNLCPQIRCEWNCSLPSISYCWWSFSSTIFPPSLPAPVSHSSFLFTWCQPLYASYYIVLLYFPRYCTIRLKIFSWLLCLSVFNVLFAFINLLQYSTIQLTVLVAT